MCKKSEKRREVHNCSSVILITIHKETFPHSGAFQFQVAELVTKGNNEKKFAWWKAGSPGRTDKWSVTLSLPLHLHGGELGAAFRLLPAQTFPQIKGGFHRCVLIRGKLWSERASEGAHSPLASARRATPFRRFLAQMASDSALS